ncbi:hypothetical protein ACJX0J_034861 [Zea mays]
MIGYILYASYQLEEVLVRPLQNLEQMKLTLQVIILLHAFAGKDSHLYLALAVIGLYLKKTTKLLLVYVDEFNERYFLEIHVRGLRARSSVRRNVYTTFPKHDILQHKHRLNLLSKPGDTRWGSHYKTLLRIESMWESRNPSGAGGFVGKMDIFIVLILSMLVAWVFFLTFIIHLVVILLMDADRHYNFLILSIDIIYKKN